MNRIITIFLLTMAIASETLAGADEHAQTAQVVLDDIKSNGADAVLARLWDNEANFDAVCDAIEKADPVWLKVAVRLRAASDAGATLSLNYSVARALPSAPTRILALVGHGFTVEDICTSPYIEPDPGVAEEYEHRALAALASVSDQHLKPIAEQCASLVRIPKN